MSQETVPIFPLIPHNMIPYGCRYGEVGDSVMGLGMPVIVGEGMVCRHDEMCLFVV